jgi:predicted NAD/FAD-dependent oxidoreductase
MIDFCILGSGVAGSTIANLVSKKYKVVVLDKARGPGGRTSNKRYSSNLSFDHGMQYISPKSKSFKIFIQDLYNKKVLKIWNGNHLDFTFKKDNEIKFIGKKSNNDICKYQLKKIKQHYNSSVIKIDRYKNYWEITLKNNKKYQSKSLVLTCPYPQLKKLAKKYLNKKLLNLNVKMHPNITAMLVVKNHKEIPLSSIKTDTDVISWIANENSKKRFRSPLGLWTLQSSVKWANKNINKYKKKTRSTNSFFISEFCKLIGFNKNEVIFSNIHGWKYSYNFKKTVLSSYWDEKQSFGVCGDWFLGPKVEDAWSSAFDLYKKIKKNPLIKNKRV